MCTDFNTWDGQLSPVVTSFGTTVNWDGKVLAENNLQGGHGICNLQEIENMKNGKNATRIGIGILTSPVACLEVHIQTEAFQPDCG
jgi:hypothetical protein